ncbi:MAG: hypothetical protein IJ779_08835 [Ruminococcus sp.]|nr:hypothetical protein [Ruminococcus sp.]
MDGKTLKEIYEYDLVPDDDLQSSLDEWFNSIMEKTVEELTIADICRMLRQKICSVVAIGKAIDMLDEDPFVGELYEGQLMLTLYNAKEKYLCKRYDDIEPLLESAALRSKTHDWASEYEKFDYLHTLESFAKKIRESRSA